MASLKTIEKIFHISIDHLCYCNEQTPPRQSVHTDKFHRTAASDAGGHLYPTLSMWADKISHKLCMSFKEPATIRPCSRQLWLSLSQNWLTQGLWPLSPQKTVWSRTASLNHSTAPRHIASVELLAMEPSPLTLCPFSRQAACNARKPMLTESSCGTQVERGNFHSTSRARAHSSAWDSTRLRCRAVLCATGRHKPPRETCHPLTKSFPPPLWLVFNDTDVLAKHTWGIHATQISFIWKSQSSRRHYSFPSKTGTNSSVTDSLSSEQ